MRTLTKFKGDALQASKDTVQIKSQNVTDVCMLGGGGANYCKIRRLFGAISLLDFHESCSNLASLLIFLSPFQPH